MDHSMGKQKGDKSLNVHVGVSWERAPFGAVQRVDFRFSPNRDAVIGGHKPQIINSLGNKFPDPLITSASIIVIESDVPSGKVLRVIEDIGLTGERDRRFIDGADHNLFGSMCKAIVDKFIVINERAATSRRLSARMDGHFPLNRGQSVIDSPIQSLNQRNDGRSCLLCVIFESFGNEFFPGKHESISLQIAWVALKIALHRVVRFGNQKLVHIDKEKPIVHFRKPVMAILIDFDLRLRSIDVLDQYLQFEFRPLFERQQ